jgi:nicotinate-nucleotide pyrophosphorylase (carboxylating)
MTLSHFSQLDAFLKLALAEDIPFGDITSESVFSPRDVAKAQIKAKEAGVIAGSEVVERVFALVGGVQCQALVKDGTQVKVGEVVMELAGQTLALLAGERVALNLLQHMSGVATLTRAFCEKVADLPVKIVDTRKTTPGLRAL